MITRRVFNAGLSGMIGSPGCRLRFAAVAEEERPKKNARILMVTQSAGFKHGSVTRKDEHNLSPAERAMTDLGISSELFRVDCTQDVAKDVTKEQLDNYDIVMFYTTGDLPFADDVRDYLFNEWVKQKGHGFIGTHSAADTYHNYQPYWEMLGGTFNGHPWGSNRNGDRHRPRSAASGEQAVGRGVRDQGRDLPLQELAAREGARADEPEHGQDQAQEALSRADRLGEELWRRQSAAHEPGPSRGRVDQPEVHAVAAWAASSGFWARSRATPRPIPRSPRPRKPRPKPISTRRRRNDRCRSFSTILCQVPVQARGTMAWTCGTVVEAAAGHGTKMH